MTIAADFLEWLRPGGDWVVTAIDKDANLIETRTFSTVESLDAFVAKHEGSRNLYYNPNRLTKPVSKKPGRVDVKSLDFLQIDLDPRPGEDPDEEATRLIAIANADPPGDLPPPSFAVFSGGGVQIFWRLTEPIPINGDVDAAKGAERYNQQLLILYPEADRACTDSCHVMRLPGSTNLPDKRKREKGRKPKLSTLLYFHDDRVYFPGKFTKAEPVAEESGESFDGDTKPRDFVEVANPQTRQDLIDLGLTARLAELIVSGIGPKKAPDKDPSRSAWLWQAIAGMMRAHLDDETILNIILNRDAFRIGIINFDFTNPRGEALKQIANGRKKIPLPKALGWEAALRLVNLKYFSAIDGGRLRFYSEKGDGSLVAMNREAFD